MKSRSVWGTPENHIRSGSGNSINPGKPAGYDGGSGTVRNQFEGDQRGNKQVREQGNLPPLGTEYQSDRGNPSGASTTRADHRYGVVLGENGQDLNNPSSNGNGVLFDGVTRDTGYRANPQPPNLDSPVPGGSQKPARDGPITLADLRSGVGEYWGRGDGPKDSLLENGGVMSK